MNLTTSKIILEELETINTQLPHKKNSDELQRMSFAWIREFCHISEENFKKSIRLASKETNYIPTVAQVFNVYRTFSYQPPTVKPSYFPKISDQDELEILAMSKRAREQRRLNRIKREGYDG